MIQEKSGSNENLYGYEIAMLEVSTNSIICLLINKSDYCIFIFSFLEKKKSVKPFLTSTDLFIQKDTQRYKARKELPLAS